VRIRLQRDDDNESIAGVKLSFRPAISTPRSSLGPWDPNVISEISGNGNILSSDVLFLSRILPLLLPPPPFYGHHTGQTRPAITGILLEQCSTAHMPLMMATSKLGLAEDARFSSVVSPAHSPYLLHHLHTLFVVQNAQKKSFQLELCPSSHWVAYNWLSKTLLCRRRWTEQGTGDQSRKASQFNYTETEWAGY